LFAEVLAIGIAPVPVGRFGHGQGRKPSDVRVPVDNGGYNHPRRDARQGYQTSSSERKFGVRELLG
jgi:hypothetical protein